MSALAGMKSVGAVTNYPFWNSRVRQKFQRMDRIILEIHDPLAIFSFEVSLIHCVTLRHVPRPNVGERRVILDRVIRRIGHVRTDDGQGLVHIVRRQRAIQRQELGEDGLEGCVWF